MHITYVHTYMVSHVSWMLIWSIAVASDYDCMHLYDCNTKGYRITIYLHEWSSKTYLTDIYPVNLTYTYILLRMYVYLQLIVYNCTHPLVDMHGPVLCTTTLIGGNGL